MSGIDLDVRLKLRQWLHDHILYAMEQDAPDAVLEGLCYRIWNHTILSLKVRASKIDPGETVKVDFCNAEQAISRAMEDTP